MFKVAKETLEITEDSPNENETLAMCFKRDSAKFLRTSFLRNTSG